jgi:hypothetical protein
MAVDHSTPVRILGAEDAPFNILIVGDGFAPGAGTTAFNTACGQIESAIKACDWYTTAGANLGLWRVRVLPKQDDPVIFNLYTGAAVPGAPQTALEVQYGNEGIQRLMYGSDLDVQDLKIELESAHGPILAAKPLFRGFDVVAVLVNCPLYGGAAGTYAWISNTPPDFAAMFLHELGHVLGLKDEYEVDCGKSRRGSEKIRDANVTSDKENPPWAASITPALLPYPNYVIKKPYGHATDCEAAYSGSSTDVGVFEGAFYAHTGYYRPSHECLMRHNVSGNTFCKICDSVFAIVLDETQTNLVGG